MMNNLLKHIIVVIILFSCVTPTFADNKFDKLDEYMDVLAKHDKAMLSVAIREKGKLVYSKQIGYVDTERKIATNSDSMFRIGSISKTYTAAVVMRLVEMNKLTLNDKLSQFYPNIPNAEKITIEHLLNHRSGIFNFTNDPLYLEYMTNPQSRQKMLAKIANFDPQFEPDSQHQYSNSNYLLLSYVVEDVTQKSFSQALDNLLIEPLDLTRTKFGGKITSTNNEVHSFEFKNGWQLSSETDMTIPLGAGSVISTAEDTSLFLHKLFQNQLLSETSVNKMMSLKDNYGFALMQFPFYDKRFLGHNGKIDGFLSSAAYYPPEQISFAVLSNGMNTNFNNILIALLSAQFGMTVEIPDFTATEYKLSNEQRQRYVGEYVSEQLPLEIKIFIENEQVMAQATGQSAIPLATYSEFEFRFERAGLVIMFNESFDEFELRQGGKYIFKRK